MTERSKDLLSGKNQMVPGKKKRPDIMSSRLRIESVNGKPYGRRPEPPWTTTVSPETY